MNQGKRVLLLATILLIHCGEPDSSATPSSTQDMMEMMASDIGMDMDRDVPDVSTPLDTGLPDMKILDASMMNPDLPDAFTPDAGMDMSADQDDLSDMPPDLDDMRSGRVTFVPIYEQGSAWVTQPDSQAMVDGVFQDISNTLRTSGDFDATVEVYFTDDNPGFANATFNSNTVEVDGQRVQVTSAWASIVMNMTDEAALPDGTHAEITINMNVAEQPLNAGLVRHEMMHGLGAYTIVPNFEVSDTGEWNGAMPGERHFVSLYDLKLVDLDKNPLLANYRDSDSTFEVQPYRVERTLEEWMDGDGGIFFRGEGANAPVDMSCGTFPRGEDGGRLVFSEPSMLMSARAHPTWNTIDEPDIAFFRAMGYTMAP